MAIQFSPEEILETIRMVQMENLDIRTITMGISLRNCADASLEAAAKKAHEKICRTAARLVGVNFLGGFSALVHKGTTPADAALIASLPEALACTEGVCASINVATTRAGINEGVLDPSALNLVANMTFLTSPAWRGVWPRVSEALSPDFVAYFDRRHDVAVPGPSPAPLAP
jgi:uncharacterized protein (UPF0210 family)